MKGYRYVNKHETMKGYRYVNKHERLQNITLKHKVKELWFVVVTSVQLVIQDFI